MTDKNDDENKTVLDFSDRSLWDLLWRRLMWDFSPTSFWAGILTLYFFGQIQQSFIGKERLIEHIQNNWIDDRITLPIFIPLFAACVVYALAGYAWRRRINRLDKTD